MVFTVEDILTFAIDGSFSMFSSLVISNYSINVGIKLLKLSIMNKRRLIADKNELSLEESVIQSESFVEVKEIILSEVKFDLVKFHVFVFFLVFISFVVTIDSL